MVGLISVTEEWSILLLLKGLDPMLHGDEIAKDDFLAATTYITKFAKVLQLNMSDIIENVAE